VVLWYIAAALDRMRVQAGQGKTRHAHRVTSLRRVHNILALILPAHKDGQPVTTSDGAAKPSVSAGRSGVNDEY
jgi:hypothetical protein